VGFDAGADLFFRQGVDWDYGGRLRRVVAYRLFEPGHVAPGAVFIAGVMVVAGLGEAEGMVEGLAFFVRDGDDGVDCFYSLHREDVGEDGVEPFSKAPARRRRRQVGRPLRAPLVGGAFHEAVGVGVAEGLAVLFVSDVWIEGAYGGDAGGEVFHRRQGVFEGYGRVDVAGVDVQKGLAVRRGDETDGHFS